MRKDKNKKSKSGLGEFWDNWMEDSRQSRERTQKLVEQIKQDANKRNNDHKEYMIKDIKKSEADFIVRYGGDNSIDRTDYMTEKEATKFYNKLELDTVTTWKELIQEPLDEPEVQRVVKRDSVNVIDLGIGKIAVPE